MRHLDEIHRNGGCQLITWKAVLHQLDVMLQDEVRLSDWVSMLEPAISVQVAIASAAAVREMLRTSSSDQSRVLKQLVRPISVKPGQMVFEVNPHAAFDVTGNGVDLSEPAANNSIRVSVPMVLRRRRCEARFVLEGHSLGRKPDDGLVEAAKANVMLGMLTDGLGRTIADVASRSVSMSRTSAASFRLPSWPQRSPTRSCGTAACCRP